MNKIIEQSFELGDPTINTRMPNLLEIDSITMWYDDSSKDLQIVLTEKKSDSGQQSIDRRKLTGLGLYYFIRPFMISLLKEDEEPNDDVVLRGGLPEIELFLNQLIACADFSFIKRYATEVYEFFKTINIGKLTDVDPYLIASMSRLCDKARWLSRDSSFVGIAPPHNGFDRKDVIDTYFNNIGLYPPKTSYDNCLIAVGTMDSLQIDASVKAIEYALDNNLLTIKDSTYLIHSDVTKKNAEELKDKLPKKLLCELRLQSEFKVKEMKLQDSSLALILTEYKREYVESLLSEISKSKIAHVYVIGPYSRPSETKLLKPMTLLKWVGSAGDYCWQEEGM